MANPERARTRRRDVGLVKVGRWTRYSIATGVVLSGVLGAGVAHLLPGQSAAAEQKPAPAQHATPAQEQAQEQAAAQQPASQAPGATGTTHQGKSQQLTPPTTAPSPAPAQSQHATSGGS